MAAQKPTIVERERRITEIYKLLIMGSSRTRILEYAAKNWGIKVSTTDAMIAEAREKFLDEAKTNREEFKAEAIAQRKEIYYNAFKEKRWAIALQTLDSIAKIQGCYSKTDEELLNELKSRGYRVIAEGLESQNSSMVGAESERSMSPLSNLFDTQDDQPASPTETDLPIDS
jgi:hypothetical protein